MNADELFEAWAPQGLPCPDGGMPWTAWAKPILFAHMLVPDPRPEDPSLTLPLPELPWAPDAGSRTAVLVDLPGPQAVAAGLALATRGFRPVPLFNGAPWEDASPCHVVPQLPYETQSFPSARAAALVDVAPVLYALAGGALFLRELKLAPDAPPAFLLDSRRAAMSASRSPGKFDNRWVVLPQDFPSANLLLARGLSACLLAQDTAVPEDLAHVLVRWQEAGVKLHRVELRAEPGAPAAAPVAIEVPKPSWYKSVFYTALTVAGLCRNSAGGFGSIIPQPSSSGG